MTATTSHRSVVAATAAAAAGLVLTGLIVAWNKRRREDRIYLDYNGTTPVYPEVLQAMTPYFGEHFGNPSSHHWFGIEPNRAADQARQSLLKLLAAPDTVDPSAIWFTSCGTESDNLAIHLAIQSSSHKKRKHVVTCNIEHAAVDECLKVLLERGEIDEITRVPVDTEGKVSFEQVIAAIQPESTILVTLMLANNEVGTLQPIKPVSEYCRQHGILIHTDAAQAVGKVSVTLPDLGDPDMISLVGHKMGAPKGIAALYVRPGCTEEHDRKLSARNGVVVIGGSQEFGRRGGTLNVPYIVGMGKAAELVTAKWQRNAKHMQAMKDRLLAKLQELTQNVENPSGEPLIRVNGPADPSLVLPNTLSVGFRNVHSGVLLEHVGDQVGVSAGATCHSTNTVSTVLQALQVPLEYARGTLRVSLGPWTTPQQIDRAAKILTDEAKRQWSEQKPPQQPIEENVVATEENTSPPKEVVPEPEPPIQNGTTAEPEQPPVENGSTKVEQETPIENGSAKVEQETPIENGSAKVEQPPVENGSAKVEQLPIENGHTKATENGTATTEETTSALEKEALDENGTTLDEDSDISRVEI